MKKEKIKQGMIVFVQAIMQLVLQLSMTMILISGAVIIMASGFFHTLVDSVSKVSVSLALVVYLLPFFLAVIFAAQFFPYFYRWLKDIGKTLIGQPRQVKIVSRVIVVSFSVLIFFSFYQQIFKKDSEEYAKEPSREIVVTEEMATRVTKEGVSNLSWWQEAERDAQLILSLEEEIRAEQEGKVYLRDTEHKFDRII